MATYQQNARTLEDIINAANRHPQSNVAKLIHTVRNEPTQRNIVLLLIELSKNKDFYTDFGIQLGYYLDLFEELESGHDILNQSALLLSATGEIYSRRVDYVQELVERLIASLSKADKEIEEAKKNAENEAPAEKPKRQGRKRLVDAHSDPFEIEMLPKKLKILTKDKRNVVNKIETKTKFNYRSTYNEEQIHPALYLLSSIVDFENDEDVESKKNFQIFTYRLEHRYCTVVPDVNFRLHFVVKDYLDEEGERMQEQTGQDNLETQRAWPPLSEEYLQNLITLENKILRERDLDNNNLDDSNAIDACNGSFDDIDRDDYEPDSSASNNKQKQNVSMASMFDLLKKDAALNSSMLNTSQQADLTIANLSATSADANITKESATQLDSGLGESGLELSTSNCENSTMDMNNTQSADASTNINNNSTLNADATQNDTGLGNSLLEDTQGESNKDQETIPENANLIEANKENTTAEDANNENQLKTPIESELSATNNENDEKPIENNENNTVTTLTTTITTEAPDANDLAEHEQLMLSPTVLAIDILPLVPNKEQLTIELDDELKEMLNVSDDNSAETFTLPIALTPKIQPITLNILKIHEKHFKRKALFKLGADFDLYIKARSLKRKRYEDPISCITRQIKVFKAFQHGQEITGFCMTPARSEADFYGFDNSRLDNDFSDNETVETMSILFQDDFFGFSDFDSDMEDFYEKNIREPCQKEDIYNQSTIIQNHFGKEEDLQRDKVEENVIENNEITATTPNDKEVNTSESTSNLKENNEQSTTSESIIDRSKQPLADNETNPSQDVTNQNNTNNGNLNNSANQTIIEGDRATHNLHEHHADEIDDGIHLSDESDVDLETTTKTKIQKWHESLRPILAKSKERHHFNIFDLGTDIINTVEAQSHAATFKDVMENKDQSFCSRYFLSLLLLVNHSNLKVNVNNKKPDEPSSWSDIKIELLSTKRHTVTAEDNIGIVTNKTSTITSTSTSANISASANVNTGASTSESPSTSTNTNAIKLIPPPPPPSPPTITTTAIGITARTTVPVVSRRTSLQIKQVIMTTANTSLTPIASVSSTSTPPAPTALPQFATSTPSFATTQFNRTAIANISTLSPKHFRKRLASSDEFNVNLNTFRLVQSIEQKPIQNDEQDSGFCSNEGRSGL